MQIDEPTQRYVIHTSMGQLNKIRETHPQTNILRTLSHWNDLQNMRYASFGGKGGRLGIVNDPNAKANKHQQVVVMTLVGEYAHREWEHDERFRRELERFVEDALQFYDCLNGTEGPSRAHRQAPGLPWLGGA